MWGIILDYLLPCDTGAVQYLLWRVVRACLYHPTQLILRTPAITSITPFHTFIFTQLTLCTPINNITTLTYTTRLPHGTTHNRLPHQDGDTAMHVAASMGHLEVVKLLLDTGTGIHASNYVRIRLDMRLLLAYWNAKRYANAVLFIEMIICPGRFTLLYILNEIWANIYGKEWGRIKSFNTDDYSLVMYHAYLLPFIMHFLIISLCELHLLYTK